MREPVLRVVAADAADDVLTVIRASFGARPPLDPPTEALAETSESLATELGEHGGILATVDGEPVGSLVFDRTGPGLQVRRFGVVPGAQGAGIARRLVSAAEEWAVDAGFSGIRVKARMELPETLRFWEHHGYVRSGRVGVTARLVKVFPVRGRLVTPDDTRGLGRRAARLLRAGDLLLLSGDLGAGKTTFTQGLGAALGVRGEVTSPTFVIARVHPSLVGGPDLVHVDAYRLGGIDELDDLDLDTSLGEAVTVVEWGEAVAEGLADERLEIRLVRRLGTDPVEPTGAQEDHDPREAEVRAVGLRWLDAGLSGLFDPVN